MKEVLSRNNVRYGYVDITSGMAHLKKFLKIRDTAPSHAPARENGNVGVPTLVIDDESFIIGSPEDAERLIAQFNLAGEEK